MKIMKRSLLAVTVGSLLSISASAYADGGALKIQVHDIDGKPLTGAVINIKSPDTLTQREATTDSEGYVRLNNLDPSRKYVVTVQREGYETES